MAIGMTSPNNVRNGTINHGDMSYLAATGTGGIVQPKLQNLKIKSPKGKIRLAPIKNKSAIVDVQKARSKLKKKPNNGSKSPRDSAKLNVINDEIIANIVPSFRDNTVSTMSKRNARYSTVDNQKSIIDPNFKLVGEDEVEEDPAEQLMKSINVVQDDDDSKLYIEGANGRKISILNVKSPERIDDYPKKKLYEQVINQQSTLCSNTMNKSSKKSGFQFSDDMFGFGEDDTLTNSRVNHKRDILNM